MSEPLIDTTLARFQHTGIALLGVLAATGGSVWLIVLVFGVTGAAAVGGARASLPIWVYERFVRSSVEPAPDRYIAEEPERFGLLVVTTGVAAALVAWKIDGSDLSTRILWILAIHEFLAAFGLCLACRLHRLLPSG